MKKVREIFGRLSTRQKLEAVVALSATLFLLIAVPVYAWFSYSDKIETMTKVKEPEKLNLCAGDGDSIENFELSNIDLEDIQKSGKPKCYVFGVVTGNSKTFYDIQLAHTTNIPFTYTLYRAEETNSSDTDAVVYESLDGKKTKYYERTGSKLELNDLNADEEQYGRTLAETDDKYYSLAYDDGDKPEIYAVPMYSQVKGLETLDSSHDFYILEIGWDSESATKGLTDWNSAKNKKETDIIYITASRTTN